MSIYLQHFALKREPFSIVPDPGFLYPSIFHRQAVAHLKYGLDREGGFILLTGEVGTGKTTLTRTVIKRIPPHIRVAYILNSKLNVTDVLASICDELSIEVPSGDERSFSKKCIDALNQNLLASHADGKKTLIVIEEAQNLSPEVLETLRLLSNLETSTHKLLHILLVGQPELVDILARRELRQLNQRVVSRFHLSPLDKNDLANYVNHRLHRAGAQRPLFDAACMTALYRLTGGVPRLINLVCHQSLVAAYSLGLPVVSAKLVKQAAAEILGEEKPSPQRYWLLAALLIVLLTAGAFVLWPDRFNQQPTALDVGSIGADMPIEEPIDATVAVNSAPALSEPADAVEPASSQTEPHTETTVATTPSNPFIGLMALWGIPSDDVYSEEELASVAAGHNLRAEKTTLPNLDELEKIDRPGIVWLQENDHIKAYLITSLSAAGAKLQDRSGITRVDRESLAQRWTGRYLYLWEAPLGYSEPLSVASAMAAAAGSADSENQQLVEWLLAQFALLDPNTDVIISGGRYTAAVAQQVQLFQQQQGLVADGILGRETLMRLNQLTGVVTPTLKEAP